MIVEPDTTSGGSYRQNEHAGNTAMPTNRSSHQRRSIRESKINRLLYGLPGLRRPGNVSLDLRSLDAGRRHRKSGAEGIQTPGPLPARQIRRVR